MARVVISVVGGLSLGATYSLISLGLVLAFRGTGIFNLAHGEFLLLGAYLVAKWQASGWPLGVASVLAIVAVAAVGMLFYRLVLYRTTGLPHFIGLVASLGLAAIMDGAMSIYFGSDERTIRVSFLPKGSYRIFGAGLAKSTVILAVFALFVACATALWARFTDAGTRMRAAGFNALLASQGGINVRRFYIGAWALAGGLAALAGITYGSTNLVTPSLVQLGLAALPAVMIGGIDSIDGAVIGGLLVGLLQGFVTTYWGGNVLNAVTYGVLLLVLLVKPEGLFGTKGAVRV